MSEPITIDLYCRMSFGDDGTMFKCEDQEKQGRRDVADWARERGLTFGPDGQVRVGEVLYDHALSAWKAKVVRPSFNRIMDRLEAGEAHGVWVRDVDRFTRKMEEAERIVKVAKQGRHVLSQRSSYDFTTAKGIKRFREDAVDACYESDRISERARDGMTNKAERGRSNASHRGFARPGYLAKPKGWEAGDPRPFVSDEQLAEEVRMVRDAAARVLAGDSLGGIAEEWNAAGVRTTRGRLWNSAMLRQVLAAPSIAGINTHRGVEVGMLPGEPVLDRGTYDRLGLFFQSRKQGRPASVYLLSGILRCGKCGGLLYGRPVGKVPADGSPRRREYWCQPRPKEESGCGSLRIDQSYADRVVERMVIDRMADPRHADRITRVAARLEEHHAAIAAELSGYQEQIDRLVDREPSAVWTQERLDRKMEQYEELVADAEKRLAALGEAPDVSPAKASREEAEADWAEAGRKGSEGQRLLVRRAFPEGLTILPTKLRGEKALTPDRVHIGYLQRGYREAS